MSEEKTTRCPYCQEEIMEGAVKCKHCGEFIKKKDTEEGKAKKEKERQQKSKVYKWVAVIFGLFMVILIITLSSVDTTPNRSAGYNNNNSNTGSQPEVTMDKAQPVGVSYDQAMANLDKYFTMEKVTPVDGVQRYYGDAESGLASLEIIGDKADIKQATLMAGAPSDNVNATIENSAFAAAFMKNLFPDWAGGSDWAANAINQISSSNQDQKSTTYGNKRVKVSVMKTMGMITITVRHK